MEYYGNTLCISARELVDCGIMTEANYKQLSARKRINVVRSGKGKGRYALVAVDTLPTDFKVKVNELYPGGDTVRLEGWITSNYEIDQAAVAFFNDRSKTGLDLAQEKVKEYVVNASVLNTCIKLYDRASASKKLMGEKYDWEKMATTINTLKEKYKHTLPSSTMRFRKKVAEYKNLAMPV